MKRSFDGEIVGSIIEVRFAFSGRISRVYKHTGEHVNRGNTIASLDRTLLQTELDRQLADYEKVRGEFEIFNIKAGSASDDLNKFMKQQKQASLNASVKEVEKAKYRLDQADMISPVSGTIVSTKNLYTGLYVSPSNAPVDIVVDESLRFEFEVTQKELEIFRKPQKVMITLKHVEKEVSAESLAPVVGKNGTFVINAPLKTQDTLLAGMTGKATLT